MFVDCVALFLLIACLCYFYCIQPDFHLAVSFIIFHCLYQQRSTEWYFSTAFFFHKQRLREAQQQTSAILDSGGNRFYSFMSHLTYEPKKYLKNVLTCFFL